MQGRIIGNIANNYKIMTESGEYSCYARGKFRNQETTPIVGDNVEVGCNSVLNPGTVVCRNTNIYPLSCVRGVIPENHIYKNKNEIVEKY